MIGPCETIAEVPLFERIQTALVDARRARDENALSTLSLLKSEVVRASKEPGASGQADDQLVERVIRKEIKRRQEAIDIYRNAGRDDSARKEEAEMAVLREYVPAGLTDDEIEAVLREVIAEVKPDGLKGLGAVMKAATARMAGRADGAQVAAAARRLLAG